MIEWRAELLGYLNGVLVAENTKIGDEYNCIPKFPCAAQGGWFKTLDECTTYVLSQLAWFVWKLGVAGQRLGEGEPVVCLTGGFDRRVHAHVWERWEGVYRAHDESVEAGRMLIAERNQVLLLRKSPDYTGMDERLRWLHGEKVVYK